MDDYPLVWIMMGVAGSGKSFMGRRLAQKLEGDFLEGDRRHPRTNIAKMSAGTSLAEEDREAWLMAMERDIRGAIDRHRETVVTCSALKLAYRQRLAAIGRVHFVWLQVSEEILAARLKAREGEHFMDAVMLGGQLKSFESVDPAEKVIAIDGGLSPDEIMENLWGAIATKFPAFQKPWWQRGD
jgi:gluconokinase